VEIAHRGLYAFLSFWIGTAIVPVEMRVINQQKTTISGHPALSEHNIY